MFQFEQFVSNVPKDDGSKGLSIFMKQFHSIISLFGGRRLVDKPFDLGKEFGVGDLVHAILDKFILIPRNCDIDSFIDEQRERSIFKEISVGPLKEQDIVEEDRSVKKEDEKT